MKLIQNKQAKSRVTTRSQATRSDKVKVSHKKKSKEEMYTQEERSLRQLLLSHLPQISQTDDAYVITTHRTTKKAHPCNVLISEYQYKRNQAIKAESLLGKKANTRETRKPTLEQFNQAYEEQMKILEEDYQFQKRTNLNGQVDRYLMNEEREENSDDNCENNNNDDQLVSDDRSNNSLSNIDNNTGSAHAPLGDFHFTKNTLRSFYPKEVQLNMIRRKFQNTDRIAKGLTIPGNKHKQERTLLKMKQLARSQMNFMQTMMQQVNRRSKCIKKCETKLTSQLRNKGIELEKENCDINHLLINPSAMQFDDEDEQARLKNKQEQQQKLAIVQQAAKVQSEKVTETLLAAKQIEDGVKHHRTYLSPLDKKNDSQLPNNLAEVEQQLCQESNQQRTQQEQNDKFARKESCLKQESKQDSFMKVDLAVMNTQIGSSLIEQPQEQPEQKQTTTDEDKEYENQLFELNLALKRQKTSIPKPRKKPIVANKKKQQAQATPVVFNQQLQDNVKNQGMNSTDTSAIGMTMNHTTDIDQQQMNSSSNFVSPVLLQQKMLPDSLSLTPQIEFEDDCGKVQDPNMTMFNYEDQYMVDVFEDLMNGGSGSNPTDSDELLKYQRTDLNMIQQGQIQNLCNVNQQNTAHNSCLNKEFDVPTNNNQNYPIHKSGVHQNSGMVNPSSDLSNENLAQIVLSHQPHSYSYHAQLQADSSNQNIANPYLIEKLKHYQKAQDHWDRLSASPDSTKCRHNCIDSSNHYHPSQHDHYCQQQDQQQQQQQQQQQEQDGGPPLSNNALCTPNKFVPLQNYPTNEKKYENGMQDVNNDASSWECVNFQSHSSNRVHNKQQQFNM